MKDNMEHTQETQTVAEELRVKPIKLPDVEKSAGQGVSLLDGNFSLVHGVKVRLEVVVGQAEITVGELFALKNNSVITLDQDTAAPVEIRLDHKTIARGHLMAVGDNLGVKIEEIVPENA